MITSSFPNHLWPSTQKDDVYWMCEAIKLALQAQAAAEVPVGAILVYENQIIGQGYNQCIQTKDPSAHAEILALRQGALKLDNYRLNNTTLYVTLEPCAMCAGAMVHARIQRLVFAASDPKTGAAGSILNIIQDPRLNHRIQCTSGILGQESSALLKDFFRTRR